MSKCRLFGESEEVTGNHSETLEIIKSRIMVKNQDRDESSLIKAGQTYIGQMIAHDIVPATTNPKSKRNIPATLCLSSLYGGNDVDVYFNQFGEFILGSSLNEDGSLHQNGDIFRKEDKSPVIGDMRNDENRIISQLHLVWQKIHNKVLSSFLNKDSDLQQNYFLKTQQYIVHIFQRVVIEDFLRQILHTDVYKIFFADDATKFRNYLYSNNEELSCIPLEFSHAVFRFGHSMVRNNYTLNMGNKFVVINRNIKDLLNNKFHFLQSKEEIDWRLFFETEDFGRVIFINESVAVEAPLLPAMHEEDESSLSTPIVNTVDTNSFTDIEGLQNEINQHENINIEATFSVQTANTIDSNLVTGMDKLADEMNHNHIVDINLKANSSARIKNAGSVMKKISEFEDLQKIINPEKHAYLGILKQIRDKDDIQDFDWQQIHHELDEIPLWVFTLMEASKSRKLRRNKTRGLGIIASIIVAEVLYKSIQGARKKSH